MSRDIKIIYMFYFNLIYLYLLNDISKYTIELLINKEQDTSYIFSHFI